MLRSSPVLETTHLPPQHTHTRTHTHTHTLPLPPSCPSPPTITWQLLPRPLWRLPSARLAYGYFQFGQHRETLPAVLKQSGLAVPDKSAGCEGGDLPKSLGLLAGTPVGGDTSVGQIWVSGMGWGARHMFFLGFPSCFWRLSGRGWPVPG